MRKRMAVVASLLMTLLLLTGCPNGTASLTSVTPSKITEGSPAVTLTIVGKNFVQPVTIGWNGTAQIDSLVTTFVSSTKLTAVVPASFLTAPGTATIVAFQTGQNQTVTQPLTITIASNVPTLTAMSPQHIISNQTSTTLTLTGTNFTSSSVVDWNSTALTTTFVSSTQLTASLAQSQFQTSGVQKVTVVNSGGTSNALNFTVVAPLTITTASLPGGTVATAYSATLAATGGTSPYTWSLSAGTLPAGLTLSQSTGVISGTPTAAGTASITVQCVDSTGTLAIKRIGPQPPAKKH
jgi:hypothetical protein